MLISWHWIFFINVPIGIATIVLARRVVEDKPGIGFGEGADYFGAAVLTVGVMVGVYGILGVTEHGWVAVQTLGLMVVSALLVGGFVLRQAKIANPLMPLRLFKSRNVVGANVVMALLVAGMFAMFFLGALYLQRVLEYDPLEVGFAFLPSALVMGALSLEYSEKLIMRFGAKQTLIPAMFLLAAGLLWFSRAPVDGNYWIDVLPATMLIGFGAGTGFPALMGLSMSGAEPQDMGLASGLINATVQVGGAIGLSVLATLAASRTEALTEDGESAMAALNGGFHIAFLLGAFLIGVAIIAAAIAILRSPSPEEMAAMMGEGGWARGLRASPAQVPNRRTPKPPEPRLRNQDVADRGDLGPRCDEARKQLERALGVKRVHDPEDAVVAVLAAGDRRLVSESRINPAPGGESRGALVLGVAVAEQEAPRHEPNPADKPAPAHQGVP